MLLYSSFIVKNEDATLTTPQSFAVGRKTFMDKMKGALGYRAKGRKIIGVDDTFELREVISPFGNADILGSQENTYLWNQ